MHDYEQMLLKDDLFSPCIGRRGPLVVVLLDDFGTPDVYSFWGVDLRSLLMA